MKLKSTVLLATFVVTMGLLLGASTAQAATVILDEDDNVIRIENLEVLDISLEITFYNVDFVHDKAVDVYATGKFDFPIAADALAADLAVRDALNAEDPIPAGAGPQGSDQFFIGTTERFGRVLAVGSQIIVAFWDDCETDCIAGNAILDPDDPFTYAKFTETQDVPPGKATLISPSGTITDNTPTYTWNAVANSAQYQLFVRDSTEEEIINQRYTADEADCGDGTGECSVTPKTVLADDSHEWWIRTKNEFGNGQWSDKMSFTVDTSTGPNVILDEDDNVIGIENLPVLDENTQETTIYDVDFIFGTVTEVYGSGLDFDFPAPENDENIFIALAAVNNALNAHDPIPLGAGPQGTNHFFIGYKQEDGPIVAAGGEPLVGVWGPCGTDPCLDLGELQLGVAVLSPNDPFTWADFTVAE